MAVNALLRRRHFDDRVDVESLFFLDRAVDGHRPRAGFEIFRQLRRLVFVGRKFVIVVVIGHVFIGRDGFGGAENELFWMPSICCFASAVIEGEPSSRKPTPRPRPLRPSQPLQETCGDSNNSSSG